MPRPVLVFLLLAPAEVYSQLHSYTFDRRPRPLIDRQQLAWPVETVAILELQDFQVSVSWLFTAVYKTLNDAE